MNKGLVDSDDEENIESAHFGNFKYSSVYKAPFYKQQDSFSKSQVQRLLELIFIEKSLGTTFENESTFQWFFGPEKYEKII